MRTLHDHILGTTVVVEPLRQRYTLPPDVPPPPGMTREEFNTWSRQVCGFRDPIIQDGHSYIIDGRVYMNRRTYTELKGKLNELATLHT